MDHRDEPRHRDHLVRFARIRSGGTYLETEPSEVAPPLLRAHLRFVVRPKNLPALVAGLLTREAIKEVENCTQ